MHARTLALVLCAVVFSVIGQLFLKSGARHLAGQSGLEFLLAACRDGRVLAGLGAWGASTLSWLFVLRDAPLSRAYGLTSLTYVLVLAAGVTLFGEQIRRVHLVGTVLIVLGIACLLYGD